MSQEKENFINRLTSLLQQSQTILIGYTTQTGIGSLINVKVEGRYIEALAVNVVAPGKVLLVRTDRGWEAYAERTNRLVSSTSLVDRRSRNLQVAPNPTSKIKGLLYKSGNPNVFIGLDRKPVKSLASQINVLANELGVTLETIQLKKVVNTGKGKNDYYLISFYTNNYTDFTLAFIDSDNTVTHQSIDGDGYYPYFNLIGNGLCTSWFIDPVVIPSSSDVFTENPYSYTSQRSYDLKNYLLTKNNATTTVINDSDYYKSQQYDTFANPVYSFSPLESFVKREGLLPLPNGDAIDYLTLDLRKETVSRTYSENNSPVSVTNEGVCRITRDSGFGVTRVNENYASSTQTYSSAETRNSSTVEEKKYQNVNFWFYADENNFGYTISKETLYKETSEYQSTNREGSDTYISTCLPEEETILIEYTGVRNQHYYKQDDYKITRSPRDLNTKHYIVWDGNTTQLDDSLSPLTFYVGISPAWQANPEDLFTATTNTAAPLDYITNYTDTTITNSVKNITSPFSYYVQTQIVGDFKPNYGFVDPLPVTNTKQTTKELNPFWDSFEGREVHAFLYINEETTYWYTGYISSSGYTETEIAEFFPSPDTRNAKTKTASNASIIFTNFKKINTKELGYSLGNPNFLIVQTRSNNFRYLGNTTVTENKIYSVDYVDQEKKKALVYVYEYINNAIRLLNIIEEKIVPVSYAKANLMYGSSSYYP